MRGILQKGGKFADDRVKFAPVGRLHGMQRRDFGLKRAVDVARIQNPGFRRFSERARGRAQRGVDLRQTPDLGHLLGCAVLQRDKPCLERRNSPLLLFPQFGHPCGQLFLSRFLGVETCVKARDLGLGGGERAQVRVQWPQGGWSAWQPVEADRFYNLTPSGLSLWRAP